MRACKLALRALRHGILHLGPLIQMLLKALDQLVRVHVLKVLLSQFGELQIMVMDQHFVVFSKNDAILQLDVWNHCLLPNLFELVGKLTFAAWLVRLRVLNENLFSSRFAII